MHLDQDVHVRENGDDDSWWWQLRTKKLQCTNKGSEGEDLQLVNMVLNNVGFKILKKQLIIWCMRKEIHSTGLFATSKVNVYFACKNCFTRKPYRDP